MDILSPLLIVAAVVFVIYRQTTPRPADRPGILYVTGIAALYGLLRGGLVDPHHQWLSVALLLVELGAAVGLGVVRALTVRMWRDEAGVAWSRASLWTIVVWLVSIASRVALMMAGHVLGVTTATSAVLVFMGATLGAQALVVAWRGRRLPLAVRPSQVSGAVAS